MINDFSKSVQFSENQVGLITLFLRDTSRSLFLYFSPLFYAVDASGQTWVPV